MWKLPKLGITTNAKSSIDLPRDKSMNPDWEDKALFCYFLQLSKDKLEDMDVSLTFCHFP